jgi:hypothetical protein
MRRQHAGQNGGVRRQRERRRGHGVLEAHAARGQPIDVRRGSRARPIRADVIGAQRVEGDEEDVGGFRFGAGAAPKKEQRGDSDER